MLPFSLIVKIEALLSFGSFFEDINPSLFKFFTTTVVFPGVLEVSFVIVPTFKSPR